MHSIPSAGDLGNEDFFPDRLPDQHAFAGHERCPAGRVPAGADDVRRRPSGDARVLPPLVQRLDPWL